MTVGVEVRAVEKVVTVTMVVTEVRAVERTVEVQAV